MISEIQSSGAGTRQDAASTTSTRGERRALERRDRELRFCVVTEKSGRVTLRYFRNPRDAEGVTILLTRAMTFVAEISLHVRVALVLFGAPVTALVVLAGLILRDARRMRRERAEAARKDRELLAKIYGPGQRAPESAGMSGRTEGGGPG